MCRRGFFAAGLLLFGGCAESGGFFLAKPEPAQSALVVMQAPTGERELVGLDLRSDFAPVPGGLRLLDGGDVTVLFFSASIDELQLGPGRIVEPEEAAPHRRLPEPPFEIQRSRVAGAELSAWTRLLDLDLALSDLRLPRLDQEACLRGGGCGRSSSNFARCEIPCAAAGPTESPAAPEPPELPTFTSTITGLCPDGFTPHTRGELTVCAPELVLAAEACAAEDGLFLTTGCARVGRACPLAGGFPAADAPAVYVSAAGSDLAEGTRESPLRTIAAALARISTGGTVRLSRDVFDEDLVLASPVRLEGACAGGSLLRGDVRVEAGVAVRLEELHLVGTSTALSLERGAVVELAASIVEAPNGWGILAHPGSRIDVTHVLLRGMERDAVTLLDAQASLVDVSMEDVIGSGVSVRGPNASLNLDALVLRGGGREGQAESLRDGSSSVRAEYGASVLGARLVVRDREGHGVVLLEASRGSLAYLWTSELVAGTSMVGSGSRLELDRVVSVGGTCARMAAHHAGSELHVTNAWVQSARRCREVDVDTGLDRGWGLLVGEAATLIADSVLIESCHGRAGVAAAQPETSIRLTNLTVRDQVGTAGLGVYATSGEFRKILIERAMHEGVNLTGESGASFVIEDVVVRDTMAPAPGWRGALHGISIVGSGQVALRRGLVERARDSGVRISGGGGGTFSITTLEDVEVHDVGEGVYATGELELRIDRAKLRNASAAAVKLSRGADADLRHILVEADPAAPTQTGFDLGLDGSTSPLSERASLKVRTFTVSEVQQGAVLGPYSSLELVDGEFSSAQLGILFDGDCESNAVFDGVGFVGVEELMRRVPCPDTD